MAAPVESKVKAATLVTAVLAVVVAVLNVVVTDSALLGLLPAWLQAVLLAVVPPLLTAYAGWKAKHTPRPDLDQQ